MFHVPNTHRVKDDPLLGSTDKDGNNGLFLFYFPMYVMRCIASDGCGWEHVSVSLSEKRCPTWEEMCFVKRTFWDAEDAVMQLHPPDSQYVDFHPYCLHLWRPIHARIPLPDARLLGPRRNP